MTVQPCKTWWSHFRNQCVLAVLPHFLFDNAPHFCDLDLTAKSHELLLHTLQGLLLNGRADWAISSTAICKTHRQNMSRLHFPTLKKRDVVCIFSSNFCSADRRDKRWRDRKSYVRAKGCVNVRDLQVRSEARKWPLFPRVYEIISDDTFWIFNFLPKPSSLLLGTENQKEIYLVQKNEESPVVSLDKQRLARTAASPQLVQCLASPCNKPANKSQNESSTTIFWKKKKKISTYTQTPPPSSLQTWHLSVSNFINACMWGTETSLVQIMPQAKMNHKCFCWRVCLKWYLLELQSLPAKH